ncbi:MAG: NAD(P)-dependent oxidoreductase [Solirubrobacterales bacterium]
MRILFVTDQFPTAREMLAERLPEDEVLLSTPEEAPKADVIVPLMGKVDAGLMDRVRPRLIQQFGVGLEGVDVEAAAARGIAVANVPAHDTGNADAVGEIAVLHLLSLSRRFGEARASVDAGRLGEPVGMTLQGARVVVLGLGAIGRAVARRLRGFEVETVGVATREREQVGSDYDELGLAAYFPVRELLAALAGADAIVVCAVLNEATRGLVGAAAMDAMRAGALLVNVARGPVVDHEALLAALRSGQIGGAGLDVFWQEPIDPADPLLAERVTVTPHIGGVTTSSYGLMSERVAANVERLRTGEPLAATVTP